MEKAPCRIYHKPHLARVQFGEGRRRNAPPARGGDHLAGRPVRDLEVPQVGLEVRGAHVHLLCGEGEREVEHGDELLDVDDLLVVSEG